MLALLPGDVLSLPQPPTPSLSSTTLRLGPGLLQLPNTASPASTSTNSSSSSSSASHHQQLLVTKPGLLGHIPAIARQHAQPNPAADRPNGVQLDQEPTPDATRPSNRAAQQTWWIEGETARYIPAPGDSVVGQVTHRSADAYLVHLASAHLATLPALAFEGATKRTKPNLRVGSLVYARVASAPPHAEPELSCVDAVTGKSQGYGELRVAERETGHCMVFGCSLALARSLLRPTHRLLPTLASHFSFEAAVGHNGLVWARTQNTQHLVALGRVLRIADRTSRRECRDGAARGGGGEDGEDGEEDDEGEEEDDDEESRHPSAPRHSGGAGTRRIREPPRTRALAVAPRRVRPCDVLDAMDRCGHLDADVVARLVAPYLD